jgi:hypothetical protein
VFARVTHSVSADLQTRITPCQFGGNPDCASCGCIASAGLGAVGRYKLGGVVPIDHIFDASIRVGHTVKAVRERLSKPARPISPGPQAAPAGGAEAV